MPTAPPSPPSGQRVLAIGLAALPMAGLAMFLAVPRLDLHWEHHPSHFWLVFGAAGLNVVLGLVASEAARQRSDARLFLVSLALLASAGFLALHALATPGVVLPGPNAGFVLATPVGLLVASGFAALSAMDLDHARAAALRRMELPLRLGLVVVLVAWAVASPTAAPVAGPDPRERAGAVAARGSAVRHRGIRVRRVALRLDLP